MLHGNFSHIWRDCVNECYSVNGGYYIDTDDSLGVICKVIGIDRDPLDNDLIYYISDGMVYVLTFGASGWGFRPLHCSGGVEFLSDDKEMSIRGAIGSGMFCMVSLLQDDPR